MEQQEAKKQTVEVTPEPMNEQAEPIKKSGYFRWQGLVGFTACVGLVGAGLFVYGGQLIKVGIEEGGGWYWGAEVNVAEVELNWSPFKLALINFEATDAKAPDNNLVAFGEATVSMDLWQSILGKALVHELVIDNVQMNKARASRGEVYVQPGADANAGEGELSLFDQGMAALPSADDLLKQANLKTVTAGIKLRDTYKTEKSAIDALMKELPDKAKLESYKRAIKRITSTKNPNPAQIIALTKEFNQLKAQFEQDKVVLEKARKQLGTSTSNITTAVVELKDAPAQDWQELSSKYNKDGGGLENFTEQLFGEQTKEFYDIAKKAYAQFKPMLDKMNKSPEAAAPEPDLTRGRFVHFPEEVPMPDWLIEKARISVKLDQGDFSIEINELNAQHWLRQKPTTMTVKSSNLLNSGGLALNANLYLQENNAVRTDANWKITDLPLVQLPISESKDFNLTLVGANLQMQGDIKYADDKLNSNNTVGLSKSVFKGNADSSVGKAVVDILSGVDKLSLGIVASGAADSPDFGIKSPELDQLIVKAVKQQVKKQLNKLKDKTMQGLQTKVAEQLNLSSGDAKLLEGFDGSFDNIDKVLEELLKSQLGNFAKDGLLKKLGDLFN